MERPETRPFPPLNEEVITELDLRFPDRCPRMDESDRAIWHYAGQRSVVEFLKKVYLKQVESRFNNVQGP